MITVGSPIHVRKLKPGGNLDYAWDGVVVRCDDSGIVLRAEFNVDLVERNWATLRRGDIFHEFYFWDRWFNIFQISEPNGTLKGWYCNVGQPPELDNGNGDLNYVDLGLDVWTRPDGKYVVLDQDDFDALLSEHPELTDGAEGGRDALLELVKSGRLPLWTDR